MELKTAYNRLVDSGKIQDDPAQRGTLAVLDELRESLGKQGKLAKLLGKSGDTKSIYLWGHVGRGKSMLMDLFFDSVAMKRKRRVHFHAFMQEVHDRIHQIRQDGARGQSGVDPVMALAQEIARDTTLLCFDELQATDVADATLLYRLFYQLFEKDVVVVSTSNRPPESLYTGGVQRERFDKFIALINQEMRVVAVESPSDYRGKQAQALKQTYFYPLGKYADEQLAMAISQIVPDPHPHTEHFTIKGRKVPLAFYDDVTGRASFRDLCEAALGPADYLALSGRLETLVLTDVPELAPEKRNEAKRFVTLIDALYEHKVKLLVTAECPMERIYTGGDGSFEFARTVSRLKEMQSEKWQQN